jgi:hypothetical protein
MLEHCLASAPAAGGLAPLVAALCGVANLDDAADCAAFEMARTAVLALLTGDPSLREGACRWNAQRLGCDGDRDVVDMLELARGVEMTAAILRRPPKYRTRNKAGVVVDRPMTKTGRALVESFRSSLVRHFGSTVPSVEDLSDWLARHSPKKGKGKLVTAGIVARIVHRGRILNAHTDDEGRTLRRVTMALKRHGFKPIELHREFTPLVK